MRVMSAMRRSSVLLGLLACCAGAAEYRPAAPNATLASFTLTVKGPWTSMAAVKRDGGRFTVHSSRDGRYLLQEGAGPLREFRNAVTGAPVRPSLGGWEQLLPAAESETVTVLGHVYRRAGGGEVAAPVAAETVYLQADMWVGPASNRKQKDETRRYDTSEYEYVDFTEADYRTMAEAGVTCVRVNERQAPWADRMGLFYWGTASLPYPEMLYRPQYLGPVLYLDEPAVGTRDHVLRPRMAKDPALRRAMTPAYAMEAFREHFAESHARAAGALMKQLRARKDIDVGTMNIAQANLYSWETMEANAGYELLHGPAAFVWEPAGRVGSHRTVPELNMTYGTRFPMAPHVVPSIINGFLRGAARATGKQWGISIYGAVEPGDAPYWLTRAYDDGATRFFFWDNYQLACVPFGEVLALARHLKAHARAHPRLKKAPEAELAIVIPAGYNLGHVFFGKGMLWGIPELNGERRNAAGSTYREVMSAVFAEMEKAMRRGVAFDVLWDLPGLEPKGYREVVRIGEGTRFVRPVMEGAPDLRVDVSEGAGGWFTARATTNADVYYTTGADNRGEYRNARFYWELYGPEEEDLQVIPPGETVRFALGRKGIYRLRVATVDRAGRSTVVWKELTWR